jgi:hypothetical protein
MEKDHDNQSHWVPLDTRIVIQGLLAERDKETRIYVVTIDAPPEHAWIHDRWPRLMRLADQQLVTIQSVRLIGWIRPKEDIGLWY